MIRTYCDVCETETGGHYYDVQKDVALSYMLPGDIHQMCVTCGRQYEKVTECISREARDKIAAWVVKIRGGVG